MHSTHLQNVRRRPRFNLNEHPNIYIRLSWNDQQTLKFKVGAPKPRTQALRDRRPDSTWRRLEKNGTEMRNELICIITR